MQAQTAKIFQSGEKVPMTGVYEVAGAEHDRPSPMPTRRATGELESPVRELQQGDMFPSYKGRAVIWHLCNAQPRH
ncbi:MAG TPA: hypothetical protein VMT24_04345 [Aggregatilineaceae bacterium]|nr:hypothetical protein [Aggregatilineaceae bacterium]